MAGFVVAAVMDEDASITSPTITTLIIVFAPLRVIVSPCRDFHKVRSSLRPFQGARVFLLAEDVLRLFEVVLVGIFTTVDFRIQFA